VTEPAALVVTLVIVRIPVVVGIRMIVSRADIEAETRAIEAESNPAVAPVAHVKDIPLCGPLLA
jgi:hypothetical protein